MTYCMMEQTKTIDDYFNAEISQKRVEVYCIIDGLSVQKQNVMEKGDRKQNEKLLLYRNNKTS